MNKRTCVVTRKTFDREQLIKITKTKDGEFFVEDNNKGRSAYVSLDANPITFLKLRSLHKAFRMEVPKSVYEQVVELLRGNNG